MTEDLRARAEKLLAKITPGEWHAPGLGEIHSDHEHGIFVGRDADGDNEIVIADGCDDDNNSEFIAASPQLVRDLVQALTDAEARAVQAEQERDSLRLERDAVESQRVRDNAYLLARAEKAEQEIIAHVVDHWFTQGGEAQFGKLGGNPQNADELIAAILRVVRQDREAQRRQDFEAMAEQVMALPIVGHFDDDECNMSTPTICRDEVLHILRYRQSQP